MSCIKEGGVQTTFMSVSPTDRPTDQGDYLSLRVTLPHGDVERIKSKVLFDIDEWCIYFHGGPGTDIAEHMHICVLGSTSDRIRKRLKDNIGGGNKVYSVKQFDNGLRGFVFYCSHEGSTPLFKGDRWQDIIDSVKTEGSYKKRRIDDYMIRKAFKPERDWILTYSNLVSQAVSWRNKNLKGEDSLKSVVKHMIAHTKWRPSKQMYKEGVPSVYQMDFEFRIGVRSEPDMDWWEPKQFV